MNYGKKNKSQEQKNVYELAQERLKVIFNEFDNIYVSFSGGRIVGSAEYVYRLHQAE